MLSQTPPTDNLYKYIAVSGIVLLITCLALEALETERLNEALALNLIVQYKAETMGSENDQIREERFDTLAKKTIAESNFKDRYIYLKSGQGVGILCAIVGFHLWYKRLQKYLDRKLVLDIEGKSKN